jgi:hypothetical protein
MILNPKLGLNMARFFADFVCAMCMLQIGGVGPHH